MKARSRTARTAFVAFGCFGAMVLLLPGAPRAVLLAWAVAMPLCTALLFRGDRRLTAFVALGALGVGCGLPLARGAGWMAWLEWSVAVVLAVAVAVGEAMAAPVEQGPAVRRLEEENAELRASLQQSEERRRRVERLAAMGQLAAGVAHEVNNPLSFVRANLRFVMDELDSGRTSRDELLDVLREAQTGTDRIAAIVGDLRTFARDGRDEPARVNPHEVVSQALRLAGVRFKGHVEVRNELPSELPEVQAIPGRLAQVMLNLLVNAADALENRPSSEARTVWLRAERQAETLCLAVEDNGPGLPAEVQQHLFEPFFTTKGPDKGTGLGLALSREYVERFGGRIVAGNRREGGASFRVELPLASHGLAALAPAAEA